MAFDTRSITLTEIAAEEFLRRKNYWGRERLVLMPSIQYMALDSPFFVPLVSDDPADDYVTLFRTVFRRSDLNPHLCVRSGHGWGRYIRKQLEREDLEKLAQVAAADQFKKNYLEVVLCNPEIEPAVRARYPYNRPIIECTESVVDEIPAIVGYQVSLPVEYRYLFTLRAPEPDPQITLIKGFWMP